MAIGVHRSLSLDGDVCVRLFLCSLGWEERGTKGRGQFALCVRLQRVRDPT